MLSNKNIGKLLSFMIVLSLLSFSAACSKFWPQHEDGDVDGTPATDISSTSSVTETPTNPPTIEVSATPSVTEEPPAPFVPEPPYGKQLEMKNGFDDPIVLEYFEKDIQMVNEWTDSKHIRIACFDVDLTGDGLADKIVAVESPIHSGSHGDTFSVLINNHDGSYNRISGPVMPFGPPDFSQPIDPLTVWPRVYVSDVKTNGFFNIIFDNDPYIRELYYEDGKYEPRMTPS